MVDEVEYCQTVNACQWQYHHPETNTCRLCTCHPAVETVAAWSPFWIHCMKHQIPDPWSNIDVVPPKTRQSLYFYSLALSVVIPSCPLRLDHQAPAARGSIFQTGGRQLWHKGTDLVSSCIPLAGLKICCLNENRGANRDPHSSLGTRNDHPPNVERPRSLTSFSTAPTPKTKEFSVSVDSACSIYKWLV